MNRPIWFVPALLFGVALAVRADDRRIQVESRGPLHEAYAQPWEKNPSPNEAVAQQPPEPIAEEPPDARPAGDGVQWIPGYWQWDDDKKDFVWVSGLWRDAPTGRRWVQGFWANTADGYRWVNGHWAADQEQDYQYVPTPPINDETGPQTRAPDADSFYIPGTAFYSDNGYTYRDGYWADIRPGYTWVPARYIWTPHGWIFSNGYWDYALGSRGLLFAPAYFGSRYGKGYSYRPNVTVGFGAVSGSLFVRPGYGHYYFGDYYGRSYVGAGYQPWVNFATRQYDPIFAYERWANRSNSQWLSGLHATYNGRVNGTLARPSGGLTPLGQSGQRLVSLSTTQRSALVRNAQQMVQRSVAMTRSTASHSSNPNLNAQAGNSRGGTAPSVTHNFAQPRSNAGPTTSFKPAATAASPAHRAATSVAPQHHTATATPRSAPANHMAHASVQSFSSGHNGGGRTSGSVGHSSGSHGGSHGGGHHK